MTKTAVAAREPKDSYDELSLDERDRYDRIAVSGYKPVQDGSRWSAESLADGTRIGPYPDLEMLEEAVGLATEGTESTEAGDPLGTLEDDEPVGVEIDQDHKGNTYLPHVKPIIDEQLASAAGEFFAVNTEWKDAGKRRKEKLGELATIAELKRGLFVQDPDNTNSLIYHAGGLLIRIAKESKTTVSVEEDESE